METQKMETKILTTLRKQAWERAKGELEAVMSTFWHVEKDFENFCAKVELFIKDVEDNGMLD